MYPRHFTVYCARRGGEFESDLSFDLVEYAWGFLAVCGNEFVERMVHKKRGFKSVLQVIK